MASRNIRIIGQVAVGGPILPARESFAPVAGHKVYPMWQYRVATKYIFSEASRPSKFDASAAEPTGGKIRFGTGPSVLIG
jgi:hypothetical protein